MKYFVVIPICGLANRLRMMASAQIMADELNINLKIIWNPEECCNVNLDDLFETNFFNTTNIEEVNKNKYIFKGHVHTNNLFTDIENFINTNDLTYFILNGGHDFKLPITFFTSSNFRSGFNSLIFPKSFRISF